ncbi:MAG: hypothetical protein KKF89_05040, partial [Nanoarchaeota archaeon]|nr:hypothetical protein [Nanoarchaeota archaeon]
MTFLLWDLDNTLLQKHKLENLSYQRASMKLLNREISVTKHPITGESTRDFMGGGHKNIWSMRIEQILAAGEKLVFNDGQNQVSVNSPNDVNIDLLIETAAQSIAPDLEAGSIPEDFIVQYIKPEEINIYKEVTDAIAVATLGPRIVQESVLKMKGYFTVIDQQLSSYLESGDRKARIIASSIAKYFSRTYKIPEKVVYIGDAVKDMAAIIELKRSRA